MEAFPEVDGRTPSLAEDPALGLSQRAKLEILFTRSAPIKGGLTEGAAVAPDGTI